MGKIRVGVLRGGPSSEYEVSLKTGASVLKHLPEGYQGCDVFIARDGTWHYRGVAMPPERVVKEVDVLFNALHGEYGEDGRVQNILDRLAVPYTGSGVFPSAVGMNKHLAKEALKRAGIKVPYGLLFQLEPGNETGLTKEAFNRLSPPWVVKPLDRGSSVGLALAKDYTELAKAVINAAKHSRRILIEQYIPGREATVGVVDAFRDHSHYALPAIEIRRPGGSEIWDYQSKYNGLTEEVCPGLFTTIEKKQLEELAVLAHQTLGLRHYSRTDFIVSPRGLYLLEVNTLPGMTAESLLPKALAAVGCNYPDFLDHVLSLAISGR